MAKQENVYTTPAGVRVEAPPHLRKPKSQLTAFNFINGFIFVLVCLIIIIPIWKVLIDSLDLTAGYGLRLLPGKFGLGGYESVFTNPSLLRPLWVSIYTTVGGTFLGLLLSTMGAYVLIQWDMPFRTLFANILLFTMIFSGGMIPEYLVMKKIGLVDSMWILVFKHGMNVYNLVLMKNFFEGIPESLYEAAEIDGCSPMGIFFKIVLPLSKAALASIGLMFAVTIWNDYSTVKIYIMNPNQVNFQYKLRNMVMDGDTPTTAYKVSQSTLFNAGIISAILPFMLLYPFLQKYFVQGVNIGAVKE